MHFLRQQKILHVLVIYYGKCYFHARRIQLGPMPITRVCHYRHRELGLTRLLDGRRYYYPRESEGLCFHQRWFVCLSVFCLSVCLFVTTITK